MPASNPARFDRSAQHRRAMLAKINIARHQLQIVEDDYRQLLFDSTGKISLRDCSDHELDEMLAVLKKKGFSPLPKRGGKAAAMHPMARKARAMWISLYHLNAVHNPSEHALEAFAKRQLGCEKLVWARQSDAYRLIEALKAMASRNGWKQVSLVTGKPLTVLELQEGLCGAIIVRLKDAGLIPHDWTLDDAAWKLCGIDTSDSEGGYTAGHYERLAKALGDKLREYGQKGEAA